jgi:hypothetical protein
MSVNALRLRNPRAFLIGVALATVFLASEGSAQSSRTPPTRDNWQVAVRNGTYDGVALRNGEHREATSMLYIDSLAVGDIDGDGVEDAAIILVNWGGGSGWFYTLAAIRNDHGRPVTIAEVPLGDRIKIQHLAIHGSRISVAYLTQGPNDGMCCASLPVESTFVLRGQKLERDDPSNAMIRPSVTPAPNGAAMRTTLRDLAIGQEVYFSQHAKYATALPSFAPPRGIALRVGEATAIGWSAVAIDALFPHLTCGMFVGRARPPHAAMSDGAPTCWPR